MLFLKKDFIYSFLERGRKGELEGERRQCVVASSAPLTGNLDCNPGMCPDWKSSSQCFGSQAQAQSTELHQPGPILITFELSVAFYIEKHSCLSYLLFNTILFSILLVECSFKIKFANPSASEVGVP